MCFKNAVNCLLGGNWCSEDGLLAWGERVEMSIAVEVGTDDLGLFDETGNFSLNFAEIFLFEMADMSLEKFDGDMDAKIYDAFLVLDKEVWFAVKREHGSWWNLNGNNPEPVAIGEIDTYLGGMVTNKALVWCCVPVSGGGSEDVDYDY